MIVFSLYNNIIFHSCSCYHRFMLNPVPPFTIGPRGFLKILSGIFCCCELKFNADRLLEDDEGDVFVKGCFLKKYIITILTSWKMRSMTHIGSVLVVSTSLPRILLLASAYSFSRCSRVFGAFGAVCC